MAESLKAGRGSLLPVSGPCRSSATLLSGPVPARNADPDVLKSKSKNKKLLREELRPLVRAQGKYPQALRAPGLCSPSPSPLRFEDG